MVMALLVSIVFAIIVGGLATPRTHVARRAITLAAAPAAVYDTIRNVADYPDWRDDVQSVQLDTTATDALRWTEVSQRGSVSYVADVNDAPSRFTARITDDDLGYSGEWRYTLTPSGTGTRLVIAEHGSVGNPIFRFFGAHFIGFTRGIDAYLRNLALHLGERATPEDARASDGAAV